MAILILGVDSPIPVLAYCLKRLAHAIGEPNMTEIPYGFCQCGCGQKAKIANATSAKFGWVAGEPRRYLCGHQPKAKGAENGMWKGGRTKSRGYVMLRIPNHPRANPSGYVFEHLVIAEKALGKALPEGACVHHVNGKKADNRSANLVICQDNAYHMLIHQRQRALDACGNPNWLSCRICGQYEDPSNLAFDKGGTYPLHRACKAEKNRKYWRRRAARKREATDA